MKKPVKRPNFKSRFLEALKTAREQLERDRENFPGRYNDKKPNWFHIAGYLERDFPEVAEAILVACDRPDLAAEFCK